MSARGQCGVLLVDDDDDLRSVIAELIRDHGYRVEEAVDGYEAVRILEKDHAIGMILLDLIMPGMDGRQFLEVRRKNSRFASIPVVVMTAGNAPLAAPDIVTCLMKPMSMKAILDTIHACIGAA